VRPGHLEDGRAAGLLPAARPSKSDTVPGHRRSSKVPVRVLANPLGRSSVPAPPGDQRQWAGAGLTRQDRRSSLQGRKGRRHHVHPAPLPRAEPFHPPCRLTGPRSGRSHPGSAEDDERHTAGP